MNHGRFFMLLLTALLVACNVGSHSTGDNRKKQSAGGADTPISAPAISADNSQAKEKVAMPLSVNASLNASGKLNIQADGVSIHFVASGCHPESATVALCNKDIALTVVKVDDGVKQTLQPAVVYINSEATLYRGPLDDTYRRREHSFVVADVNGDGHDDLLVWAGKEGAYGASSYEVYLFDPSKGEYVLNQEFSDLTVGFNGLFSIEQGKIKARSSDGCCTHIYDTYAVEDNRPVLIERVTEETSGEGGVVSRTIERRIDGKLQEVKAAQ